MAKDPPVGLSNIFPASRQLEFCFSPAAAQLKLSTSFTVFSDALHPPEKRYFTKSSFSAVVPAINLDRH
jgi:hypothetical protein